MAPYSYVWTDQAGLLLGYGAFLDVHNLVSNNFWYDTIIYNLSIEDAVGNTGTASGILQGTERFYRPLTDNMFLFTHPDWPQYPDNSYWYDANLWCTGGAPIVIFDGINDSPPWYGAVFIDFTVWNTWGEMTFHKLVNLENTDDWSMNNYEFFFNGTTGNTGNEDDCTDGNYEAYGAYRLEARNCTQPPHIELDDIYLLACYYGDWNDSIWFAKSATTSNYSGIEIVRGENRNITGVHSNQRVDLFLYPNPARNEVYINGSAVTLTRIELLDASGNLVLTLTNSTLMDVSNISSGTYLIRCYSEDSVYIKKLIIL